MGAWLQGLGLAAAVLSAAAFHAGSAHGPWARLRHRPWRARGLGFALAGLSLVAGVHALGAAGLCAMLACLMLALVAQPWLVLLMRRSPAVGAVEGHRPPARSCQCPGPMRETR